MKKFLLSCSALICGLATFAAVGDAVTIDGVTYVALTETTAQVSDVDTKITGTIVVPETVEIGGDSYTVTSIGEQAFYWSDASAVELPNTVTEIGRMGFYSCDNLASIKLGTGLKTIGDYGLGYAPITSIELPEGLESIGGSAFFNCSKLVEVNFPSTLKSIGTSCFYKVPLTKAVLPASLETLGNKAFLYCSKLTEVSLPDGLKTIGDGTFYGTGITSISIPASVTSIGEEAFYNAPLAEIVIGAGVSNIGVGAFSGTNITSFTVDAANQNYTALDGILYTKDKSLLIAFPAKSTVTELTLPAECIGISGEAFDRTGIVKVTVGNKFRAIDGFAFCQSSLAEFNMPESLIYIGEQAFAGTKLTNVVLPKHLPEIQNAAFADCKALTSVTIPASVNYIDIRAFYGCTSLQTVNCQGMTPPVLEDWYEAYESPFYNVPSTAVCNIPVGTTSAYNATSWKSVFSTFSETLPAAAVPTAYSPADDDEVTSFDGVTMTFASKMSIVTREPAVKVVEGSLIAGVPIGNSVSVDGWILTANSDTELRVFPVDYDMYTAPFNMESGKNYYVIIPAGVCKDAAGNLNEEITLHYNGAYVAPKVELLSVTPANDAQVSSLCTFEFEFAESVNLQKSKFSSIKVMEGSVDGTELSVEQWWAVSGKTSGTKLGIFIGDEYDGYAMPITLKDHTDYYVVLPEALFRLGSSYNAASPEIVLHYTNETGAVEVIEADDANVPAEYYNLNGVRVDNPTHGIYIKRQGAKATKVYVK